MSEDDTVTYTFSRGRVSENITGVDEIQIEYIDGGGGADQSSTFGGSGGRVENVVADVSGFDELFIWVGSTFREFGRYEGGGVNASGSGSSEVSLLGTDSADSDSEPFIAAAGGGGGASASSVGGSGGARGGEGTPSALGDGEDGEGNPPPIGGDSGGEAENEEGDGEPGDGAVDGHGGTQATIIDAGTTIEGGGSGSEEDGEIRITYVGGLPELPEPPENLTAELL